MTQAVARQKEPILGKVQPEFFDRVIYPRMGTKDPSVILRPQHGVDFGAIDIGAGQVMTLSTDPLFIQPSLGFERAAWFAFHIIVSDVAVSGLPPRYLTLDWNLPPEITDDEMETIFNVFHAEATKLGMATVTGHTARYQGCSYPMVGGATAIAMGAKERLVTPKGARPGDRIIVTKGPAVETTGLMAAEFPDRLAAVHGEEFARRAQAVFYEMTPIPDALAVAKAGGATAMHDATECGVWGGLFEIAQASGVGMRIQKDAIEVRDVIAKTCGAFGIDPFKAISEGTLLLTARPDKVEGILKALAREKIPAYHCGEVVPKEKGLRVVEGGKEHKLEHPGLDPFWGAFFREWSAREERRKKET